MAARSLAARVAATAQLSGTFLLRSGARSDTYFDKYLLEADPALLRELAEGLAGLVPAGTDALAGLELGGVPLATVLGQVTGLPVRFVRKAAKPYGTAQLAEGGPVDGLRLLVVEDVVTSGGQLLESTGALRALGATVTDAVCVVDREAGGAAALAAGAVTLHALLTAGELRAAGGGPPGGPS